MIRFEILGEPRGKGRPRFRNLGKFVQTYTDDKTVAYENLVRLSYQNMCTESYMDGQALFAKIFILQAIPKSVSKKKEKEMIMDVIRPVKKPDIDNILKSIFDGLNGVAFKDDTQIVELNVSKHYSNEPMVLVKIGTLEEKDDELE